MRRVVVSAIMVIFIAVCAYSFVTIANEREDDPYANSSRPGVSTSAFSEYSK